MIAMGVSYGLAASVHETARLQPDNPGMVAAVLKELEYGVAKIIRQPRVNRSKDPPKLVLVVTGTEDLHRRAEICRGRRNGWV